MDRRSALRTLGILAPAPALAAPALLGSSVVLCATRLTGKDVVPEELPEALAVGSTLRVALCPNVPHDEHAVAVWSGPSCLGYIPRSLTAIPANLLRQGHRLEARITQVQPEAPFWERIHVELLLA